MRIVSEGLQPAVPKVPRIEKCRDCKAMIEITDAREIHRVFSHYAHDEEDKYRAIHHKYMWECPKCHNKTTFIHMAYEGDELTWFTRYSKDGRNSDNPPFLWDKTPVKIPPQEKQPSFWTQLRRAMGL